MLSTLKNLFHRPAIRMGRVDNSLIQTTRLRNAQFVSFMSSGDSLCPFASDRYESKLRRRKALKFLFTLALGAGLTWIVLESAHALTMF